jgi:iron complex transport system permease protein
VVYVLANTRSRVGITVLLLAGVAVNSICLSGVGLLSYLARDPQARSITFWNLGTLSGANWQATAIVGCIAVPVVLLAYRQGKQLNALMLGEEEANYLGVRLKRLKYIVATLNLLLVAACTAFVGVISFVGLVVPHLLRLWKGSDNRFLIVSAVFAGAILLNVADILARTLLAPAEIPIGIITSIVGAPVFIYLLKQSKHIG